MDERLAVPLVMTEASRWESPKRWGGSQRVPVLMKKTSGHDVGGGIFHQDDSHPILENNAVWRHKFGEAGR